MATNYIGMCRTPNLFTSSSVYNYLKCKPLRINKTQLPNLASLQIDPSYYHFQVPPSPRLIQGVHAPSQEASLLPLPFLVPLLFHHQFALSPALPCFPDL